MKKRLRTKLVLGAETIRQLAATELKPIAGCGSEFHTCSLCVGVVGCATGATCPL